VENIGEWFIEMGALEFGGLSDDPITEAYEMADKLYEPGREITVWVYYKSEEHTSELQSRFGMSYAVFCLKQTITLYYS